MKKILLIDDDLEFCEILREEIELAQSEMQIAFAAHNVRDAQEFFATRIQKLDCVIVDLALPPHATENAICRDAGLHLIKALRTKHRYSGTVVVLTGSCSFADGKEAFESGCDAYLCKTRSMPDLLDALSFCVLKKVMVLSPEMRHLFLPEEITAKEARLMDMLVADCSWEKIADSLSYKNSHAASSTADRLFDKLLTWHDVVTEGRGKTKRELAVQLWRWRHRSYSGYRNSVLGTQ